jgi:antitoxin MazE
MPFDSKVARGDGEQLARAMGDSEVILKALAEIRRGQIVATKANPQTKKVYTHAFVYAVRHSVYPIFEENVDPAASAAENRRRLPFYDTYDVPHDTVKEIAELLDKQFSDKGKITFRDVEDAYTGGREHWNGKSVRVDLVHICRYFYLQGMFNKQFWKQFLSDCPAEAGGITSSWKREVLHLC